MEQMRYESSQQIEQLHLQYRAEMAKLKDDINTFDLIFH
jgi:hypothetical protein